MSFLTDFIAGLELSLQAPMRGVAAFEILLFKFHSWPLVHAKYQARSAGTIQQIHAQWQEDQTGSIKKTLNKTG